MEQKISVVDIVIVVTHLPWLPFEPEKREMIKVLDGYLALFQEDVPREKTPGIQHHTEMGNKIKVLTRHGVLQKY